MTVPQAATASTLRRCSNEQRRFFLLYGTRETEAKPTHLKAGLLSPDLNDGNLRTITYDGVEVLRAVSYLVRDRDWGPIIRKSMI